MEYVAQVRKSRARRKASRTADTKAYEPVAKTRGYADVWAGLVRAIPDCASGLRIGVACATSPWRFLWAGSSAASRLPHHAFKDLPWQCLYLRPLPQGQGSLRPAWP